MKRIFLIAFAFLAMVECVVAQEGNNTSYLLPNLPQRYRLNPAYQPEYKVFVGLPVLSGISVNYLNSSFTVEDLLFKKQDSIYIDINRFHRTLHKRNFISFNNENSIFSFGLGMKDWYATLDVVQKNDFFFRYNKDIFTFLKDGNADHPKMDFGRLGINFNSYVEFALGLSKRVDEKWTVGGRLKYLMGIGNISTADSDMGMVTGEDGALLLHSRQNIRVAAPFLIQSKATQQPFPKDEPIDWNDLDVRTDDLSVSDFLNAKNWGFAVDLGGEYKLNEKINLFASLTDLGFIRWGNGDYNYTFYQNTTFSWEGVDLSNSINKHDENYKALDDAFDDLVDSLKDNFRLSSKGGTYMTMLNPKLSLGATYQLNPTFNVGGVFRAFLVSRMLLPSLTASVNARLSRNVSAAVSYNMSRGSYLNVGAAVTAKLGPVQLYVAADNVLAANYTRVQAAGARFGVNLLLGHKDRQRKSKPEKKPVEVAVDSVPMVTDTIPGDTVDMPAPVNPAVPMVEEKVEDTDNQVVKACYVIVGSFKSKFRAEALRKYLVSIGFRSTSILINENGMFRVATSSFDNREDCWNEVFRIRKEYPQYSDAWGLTVIEKK